MPFKYSTWAEYVKVSFDLIKRAEEELTINLDHQTEAYTVHLFAHYLDKPLVNTSPVSLKILSATALPTEQKKVTLKEVGDECLMIHAMQWGFKKWPTDTYYRDMGSIAFSTRAFLTNPIDETFKNLSQNFELISNVLRKCRVNSN
jgi:hypothetical protein